MNKLHKILLISFIFIGFLQINVYAAPPLPLDIHKFSLNEKTYVGFLENDAQVLLQYRIDVPKLTLEIEKLKSKITIKELQIAKFVSANVTLLETKQFLIIENTRLQTELDSSIAWYKSQYLWFSIGLVAGTVATITVVYLIK